MRYEDFARELEATDEAGAERVLGRLRQAFERVEVHDASEGYGRPHFECYAYDSPRTQKSYVYGHRSRAKAILGAAAFIARAGDMPGVGARIERIEIPEALKELFETDPTVHAALMYYLQGDMPLETALVFAVQALASQRTALHQELTKRLMNEAPPKWRLLQ